MVRIEWTNPALNDLNEIHDYIARDSKNYANLFLKKLYDSVQKLKDFPNMGRIVPEIDDPKIRELIFQNYRIVYRIKEDYIEILTVIHGSKLLKM